MEKKNDEKNLFLEKLEFIVPNQDYLMLIKKRK